MRSKVIAILVLSYLAVLIISAVAIATKTANKINVDMAKINELIGE